MMMMTPGIAAWKEAMYFHMERYEQAQTALKELMRRQTEEKLMRDLRPSSPLYSRVEILDDSANDCDVSSSSSLSLTSDAQGHHSLLDGDDSNYALISRTCHLRSSDGSGVVVDFLNNKRLRSDNDVEEEEGGVVQMPVLDECEAVKDMPVPVPPPSPPPPPPSVAVAPTLTVKKPRKKKAKVVVVVVDGDENARNDSKPRRRREPVLASVSQQIFSFQVEETAHQLSERAAAILKLIAVMPRNKQEWRWTGPSVRTKKKRKTKKNKNGEEEEEEEENSLVPEKNPAKTKTGYNKDTSVAHWLEQMCACLLQFEYRVFTRTVDSNNKERQFLCGPPAGPCAKEVEVKHVIEIPFDERCMDCRQQIRTAQPDTCKQLGFLMCKCPRRKASYCLSCRIARWVRDLPEDEGTPPHCPDVQPFHPNGQLKLVKCQSPKCHTYYTPMDVLVMRSRTRFYILPPKTPN
jgi:hypothetical protein